MSISFVTIVPHTENLELRKDPGQIPYQLGKLQNISTLLGAYYYSMAGGRNAGPVAIPPDDLNKHYQDYPYLLTEVKDLRLHFLHYKGRGKFFERSVFQYLLKNSGKINVLNLFHFNAENIFYTILYKLLNPWGKVYLKLDINIPFYKGTMHFFNASGRYGSLKIFLFNKVIYRLFFRLVHTISAESENGLDYFSDRFKVPLKKMLVLPNGVDENRINRYIQKTKDFHEKENIIITVGKIGALEKNNKMLLDALSITDLSDWKVYFIGEIEETFKTVIKNFFDKNPGKQGKVFFTGLIDSPATLY